MTKIKIQEMKCPCCGANLSLEDNGYGETICKYCNAIVFISREETNNEGFMTINNKKDGKPIASICIPINWDVADTFIDYNRCTVKIPYAVGFDLKNNQGDTIHVETGTHFAINGPVGWVNRQTPHTFQKDFMPVENFIDEFVENYGKVEKKSFKFLEDLKIPVEGYDEKEDFERTKAAYEEELRNGEATYQTKFRLVGVYSKCACRAYECDDQVMVIYTKVHGWKNALGVGIPSMAGIGEGISNLFGNVKNTINNNSNKSNNNTSSNGNLLNKMADSGLLGGMLGKKFKSQNNPQEVVEEKTPETEPITEAPTEAKKEEVQEECMIGNLNHPGQGENLEWQSSPIFILLTSKSNYKNLYKKAYTQVCSSFSLSPEVLREYSEMEARMNAEANAMYQQQAAAQKAHGDALISLGQQRMQANYAYIDSMRARSNQQFESQRASYNSRMEAQDRMRDARTEAILGVNTYIKPDGHEVQVPVSADTAWINGKGEIIGGSAGFNPGSDWTQLERK